MNLRNETFHHGGMEPTETKQDKAEPAEMIPTFSSVHFRFSSRPSLSAVGVLGGQFLLIV
jgi:hypothetical protein